ncbi:urease accessory protein UreD [Rhizobium sp. RAF56]|jgi:urease accessory protein|uniref:urease accessory protein UreD n=1 Tax=Rhizobium sp. RAF56 TaxID=3233062 RepID=UPI003F9A07A1
MSAAASIAPQRAKGEGRLSVKPFAGRTRLAELYQDGSAKIRLPHTFNDTMEAVLINTAGGLTGGDQLRWRIAAGSGTRLDVTTQASEKIYKAVSGSIAEVVTSIEAGDGARVDWLPQETILFDRAALSRTLDVSLHETSEFLAVEAVVLGRKAMGETMREGLFRDRWRIRRAGRLIHAEDLRLDGDIAALARAPAVLSGQIAFATVLYASPVAEGHLAALRALASPHMGGVSHWRDKLVVRLAAPDGFALRKILIPIISILRGGASVPKVWSL